MDVHDINAVHTLIGRSAGAPPAVSFVITAQVLQEFREHIDEVETETRDALEKAADRFASILKRMQALSPDDCIPGAIDLLSLGFPQRGRHLAEPIVQASTVLTDHPDEVMKALDRVSTIATTGRVAPAARSFFFGRTPTPPPPHGPPSRRASPAAPRSAAAPPLFLRTGSRTRRLTIVIARAFTSRYPFFAFGVHPRTKLGDNTRGVLVTRR